MITSYLQHKSPQKAPRCLKPLNGIFHMTCHQIKNLKIKYDDLVLQNKPVQRIFLCGRILSFRQGLSSSNKKIRNMVINDNTGICTVQLFEGPAWDSVPQLVGRYVTLCVDAKIQGQYRFIAKYTVSSLALVTNFNQIALHAMSVIKDYIKFKSS